MPTNTPDVAVVAGRAHTDYRNRHPGGEDCRLVIEVADTSVAKDRAKASIYASAGVEEYWIVNFVDNHLEQITTPVDSEYQETEFAVAQTPIPSGVLQ